MAMMASQQTASSSSNEGSQSGWDTADTYEPSNQTLSSLKQSSLGWMSGISNGGTSGAGQRVLDAQGVGHSESGDECSALAFFDSAGQGAVSGAVAGLAIGLMTAGTAAAPSTAALATAGAVGGLANQAWDCSKQILTDAQDEDETEPKKDTNDESCGEGRERHVLTAEAVETAVERRGLDSRILTNSDIVDGGASETKPNDMDSKTGSDRAYVIGEAPATAGSKVVIKPQKRFFLIDTNN
jgi:hypothetical protein